MSRGFVSINPATGNVLKEFSADSPAELEAKLQLAETAFLEFKKTSLEFRSRLLSKGAQVLQSGKETYARLMTVEMGKPIRSARQEVEKCALACRWYAEHGPSYLADEEVKTEASSSFVRYQPLGPVLAVMPWNFPFWQLFRFAAPGLMAGNVALLKHASNVPQCALALQEVFRLAGFPEGVFQTLLVGSDRVRAIIEDRRVKAATLTGSVEAGRSVAALAGTQIKKTVLELGGSDPFIVMPSADLEAAVCTAVQARILNNGQSCIAAKRFVVHQDIADLFESKFVEHVAALKVGDPLLESTDVGPLATTEVLSGLEDQVRRTVEMGARVIIGGKRLGGPGNFYAPTVLCDIPPGAPACNDELFGPVASIFPARDISDALRIANDTPFGLGACLWSNDQREQELFTQEIEAGNAFVNGMVASDPRLPFGGIKQSGYGRELSAHGLREFTNIKTVFVQTTRHGGL